MDEAPESKRLAELRADGLPSDAPDFIEQDQPLDNIVPTRGYSLVPMVGLGGSAGSIQALQEFFKAVPPDTGMCFVVVVHLSPEFESTLPAMLGRCTSMPVAAAEDGQHIGPNAVYVIPPRHHLTTVDGHLRLTPLEPEKGKRVAVDLFFRSLADVYGAHATAVVFSGADGDGAIGIKRIKERGGLTIAQDPIEAQHHGMPQSAIATGMVDWVLPVGEMPYRILEYYAREKRLQLPPEEGSIPARPAEGEADSSERALNEVLAFLRTRTGRDFSYYKRATIVRRISRRMQINNLDDLPAYLTFLRTHLGEPGALLQDLLISVTNFFRDRDAFEALEKHIPELFHNKGPEDTVRVWVAACATGEEAYSMAMLLLEHAGTLENRPIIQVFACDLDEQAIQAARLGIYPHAITADVSEERLKRFFTQEVEGYRIRREVREMVLFASHDLLRDAPFSRQELISCRNLLIYLNRPAQQRVLEIFHFALRPHGLLFLGSSENVEEGHPLFQSIDKKFRIYRQCPTQPPTGLPIPVGTSTLTRALQLQEQAKGGPVLPSPAFSPRLSLPSRAEAPSASELHFRLVDLFSPASVVINSCHEIIHLSQQAVQFFRLAAGNPTTDLLALVHPSLKVPVRAALFEAKDSGRPAQTAPVNLELEGKQREVVVRISPAGDFAPGCSLIVFEAKDSSADGTSSEPSVDSESAQQNLERELDALKVRFREGAEQHTANAEELKADNEELQAMNEELRSASEELETSREELQSINEELTTVNQELKAKLDELGHANSDLRNLMSATAIPTIFLDRELRIMRYTPSTASLFRIIPSDIGRPLMDMRHQIDYPQLEDDIVRVLDTLQPYDREVRDKQGRWFLARVLPYRTLDDHIAGVVLTLVDITEGKAAEDAMRTSEEKLSAFVKATSETVYEMNADWSEMQYLEGKKFIASIENPRSDWMNHYIPENDQAGVWVAIQRAIAARSPFELEHRIIRLDGTLGWTFSRAIPLQNKEGDVIKWFGTASDITEKKRSEEAAQTALLIAERAREAAETAGREKDHFLAVLSHELRTPLTPVLMAVRTLHRQKDLPQSTRDALEMIERNVQLEAHFIDDLLDVTRITRSKLEMHFESVDVHKIMREAADVVAVDVQTKDQRLRLELNAAEHIVQGNAARLEQVFWNLLKNGSKFAPAKGELKVCTRNLPAEKDDTGRIEISVSDTGIGFDSDVASRIFDAFMQASPSITREYGGLGLGLAISKAVVDGHGGTISAMSRGANQGATFTVTLPLDDKRS